MPIQTVDLAEVDAEFIRQSINDGRYRDANEVVLAGLRLLRGQENQKLDDLRQLARKTFDEIDRGEFEHVDSAELDQFMARLSANSRPSELP